MLNCLLLWGSLNSSLESVHEHSEILFNVHLFKDVDRLALPVFESVAVRLGIYVHFLGQEQAGEQCLPLKEHIVFVRVVVMVRVFNR
jgi:hypothetical protein